MRWIRSSRSLHCPVLGVKMMKTMIIIFLLSTELIAGSKYVVFCDGNLLRRSEEIALEQVGTIEKTGKNDGYVVKYLNSVGLNEGAPYCAAGQYYCFLKAAEDLKFNIKKIPIKRTGVANAIFEDAVKSGKKSKFIASRHDLLIWRKRRSWSGHIERVIEVKSAGWVVTIGFNTLSQDGTKQGVFIKKRNIFHFVSRMPVRGLIGFEETK